MKDDFTVLQNIDKPNNIRMISGPISYTKYKILNNNIQLKEIEILGDEHHSEANNCIEQGEQCIYVTKEGIVVPQSHSEDVNCVDVPTYLGYAILDAHKNKQYTDIYIEARQQEQGRTYNVIMPRWSVGSLIKTELFLQPCGTSINRHPLCRDNFDLTRVSPNNERNWARVHSGDIRNESDKRNLQNALVGAIQLDKFDDVQIRTRFIQVMNYLLVNSNKFLQAFIEEDLGSSIREVFQPFYDSVLPNVSKDIKREYVRKYYPFIHTLMEELGGYYNDDEENGNGVEKIYTSTRASKGSLLLKRTTEEGRKILTHRVGKTYLKVLNVKNAHQDYELPHIMIRAYQKYVASIKLKTEGLIKLLIARINRVYSSSPEIKDIKGVASNIVSVIVAMFAPLYDIYTIGRLISYPESERIIYFAGNLHCENLRIYINEYLREELISSNNKHNTQYSLIKEIDIPYTRGVVNRCMRL